eukprot:XP_001611633.1 hypothetical protein [Babesia bovis T2Bo]
MCLFPLIHAVGVNIDHQTNKVVIRNGKRTVLVNKLFNVDCAVYRLEALAALINKMSCSSSCESSATEMAEYSNELESFLQKINDIKERSTMFLDLCQLLRIYELEEKIYSSEDSREKDKANAESRLEDIKRRIENKHYMIDEIQLDNHIKELNNLTVVVAPYAFKLCLMHDHFGLNQRKNGNAELEDMRLELKKANDKYEEASETLKAHEITYKKVLDAKTSDLDAAKSQQKEVVEKAKEMLAEAQETLEQKQKEHEEATINFNNAEKVVNAAMEGNDAVNTKTQELADAKKRIEMLVQTTEKELNTAKEELDAKNKDLKEAQEKEAGLTDASEEDKLAAKQDVTAKSEAVKESEEKHQAAVKKLQKIKDDGALEIAEKEKELENTVSEKQKAVEDAEKQKVNAKSVLDTTLLHVNTAKEAYTEAEQALKKTELAAQKEVDEKTKLLSDAKVNHESLLEKYKDNLEAARKQVDLKRAELSAAEAKYTGESEITAEEAADVILPDVINLSSDYETISKSMIELVNLMAQMNHVMNMLLTDKDGAAKLPSDEKALREEKIRQLKEKIDEQEVNMSDYRDLFYQISLYKNYKDKLSTIPNESDQQEYLSDMKRLEATLTDEKHLALIKKYNSIYATCKRIMADAYGLDLNVQKNRGTGQKTPPKDSVEPTSTEENESNPTSEPLPPKNDLETETVEDSKDETNIIEKDSCQEADVKASDTPPSIENINSSQGTEKRSSFLLVKSLAFIILLVSNV